MAQIHANSVRTSEIVGLLRTVTVGGIVLGCFYLTFQGIKPIFAQQPDAIKAVATVLHAIALPQIIWAVVSLGTTTAWALERKGKTRALREKAKYQQQAEQGDAYRSSSENPI